MYWIDRMTEKKHPNAEGRLNCESADEGENPYNQRFPPVWVKRPWF